jgi:uncharacterized protein YcbK (DUF882 family)
MKHHHLKQSPALSRRGFLKAGAAAMAAVALPARAWASMATGERALAFHHLHTGETLKSVYWADGAYQSEGLAEINRVLRDFRTGEVSPISTGLLDLLHTLSDKLGASGQFEVICGYRSPGTNAMLASHSSEVAKHSLHMDGLAIDIRLPGVQLADLRRAALALQSGGVGYYPVSDFVHVDVGRVRQWSGA